MYKLFFKRLIDIVASFFCILLFSPLFIIVALIIYFQDYGTPLFKQKRVGLNEQEFVVLKFRSMPLNTANVVSSNVSEIKITPFGKFIRRSYLDELPQLFNILKGDMSLIGPRPVTLRLSTSLFNKTTGITLLH